MQMCLSTSTMPSARLKEAPVGHTSTQGGSAQCWHIIGRNCVLPVRTSLISSLRIHWESVGRVPPESPFSVLQAVTQSVQSLLHLPLSINMPQRTLLLAPALLALPSGVACAVSISRTPGASTRPARPAAATAKKPRRLDAALTASLGGVVFSCFMA